MPRHERPQRIFRALTSVDQKSPAEEPVDPPAPSAPPAPPTVIVSAGETAPRSLNSAIPPRDRDPELSTGPQTAVQVTLCRHGNRNRPIELARTPRPIPHPLDPRR